MTHASQVQLACAGRSRRFLSRQILGLCLVAMVCSGLNTATLSAATYYVDANSGNDGNPGTRESPWKTLGKIFNVLKPGDTAIIRGGIYREKVSVNVNGTADNPIVIKNYPGESPIVDGTLPLTGWTQCQANDPGLTRSGIGNPNWDKIYVAQVSSSSAWYGQVILFENHQRLQNACQPDQNDPTFPDVSQFRPLRNEGGNWGQTAYLVDSGYLTQPDDFWNGATVCVWSHAANNWILTTTVKSHISSEHKIVFSQPLANPLGEGSQPDAYMLMNHPLILDRPGEYYYVASDSSTFKVYLWPRDAAELKNGIGVLDGQKTPSMFMATSTASGSYITIDGLTFRNCTTTFEWVRWSGSGSYTGNTVRNCTISDLQGGGFYMDHCDGWTVENCQIRNCAGSSGMMFGTSKNITIRNNVIDNVEGVGIFFMGVTHGEIVGNRVGKTGTHGNGISTYETCSDVLIANNVVTTPHVSCTMQNSSNLTYYNNIMYNSGGGAKIANWGGMTGTVVVAHNVMLGSSGLFGDVVGHSRIVIDNILEGAAFGATTHSNNIFVSASPSYGQKEMLQADLTKIFVDPANRNYHLRPDSPARNFGTSVTSYLPVSAFPDFNFNLDAAGKPWNSTPDVGAYQDNSADGASQAPVLEPIAAQQIAAGATLSLTVTATDPSGDTLSYTAYPLPAGATFSGQTFSWTPASNQAGTYQVTFEVTDGQLADSETATITVTAANASPVLQTIADQTIPENQTLTFSIQATDSDGDPITYSAQNLPAGASFSGQTFTWTPTYDQAGTYSVTFVASDGHTQDSKVATLVVANVNRPPALSSIGTQSIVAGTPLTLTLTATDPDGDNLTFSADPMPAGATITGNTLTWTPTAAQAGMYDITFRVSDASAQASVTGTLIVTSDAADTTAPQVTKRSPEAGAIQVPLNNLITLSITDFGKGIDASSVNIRVNDQVVYQGDVALYTSSCGRCQRSGTKNAYSFVCQADNPFDFDHSVTVKVSAADLAGNAMTDYTYSFVTEMRAFGDNLLVSGTVAGPAGKPATVSDASGNLWVLWHAGQEGQRRVYAAFLAAGADSFTTAVRVASTVSDQCNADVARGADGQLYAVWQDNQRGNWDIFIAMSADGLTWSRPVQVSDSDKNETHPAIAVDSSIPAHVYVAWEDDRNGNSDIYLASSSNSFAQRTITRVTRDGANQSEPDIVVDAAKVATVVWTDMRNGQAGIYGASSRSLTWTNVPIVTKIGNQMKPTLAVDPKGSRLHLLWVDDASGNKDVCYATFDGLPSHPVAGVSVADDTSGANQMAPAIVCSNDSRVFAGWQDWRNASQQSGDSDLFVTELTSGTPRTNVLVGDQGTNSGQGEPALGLDANGNIYAVWTDDRTGPSQIYYAATTFVDPHPLSSKLVESAAGATVGTDPSAISSPDDVSVVVPAHAYPVDIRITISKVINPKTSPVPCLSSYEFGPSGIDFDLPVTVTIPYRVATDPSLTKPYWYDVLTGAFSQQGITDVQDIVVSSSLHALRFKTTHFTPYYLMSGDAVVGSGGSSGGGCSLSARGSGSPRDLLVPYAIVALTMTVLRRRDRKKRQSLSAALEPSDEARI